MRGEPGTPEFVASYNQAAARKATGPQGTLLSLLDIPIMHTFVDDFIRWLNKTFRGREWVWPVTEPAEEAKQGAAE